MAVTAGKETSQRHGDSMEAKYYWLYLSNQVTQFLILSTNLQRSVISLLLYKCTLRQRSSSMVIEVNSWTLLDNSEFVLMDFLSHLIDSYCFTLQQEKELSLGAKYEFYFFLFPYTCIRIIFHLKFLQGNLSNLLCPFLEDKLSQIKQKIYFINSLNRAYINAMHCNVLSRDK